MTVRSEGLARLCATLYFLALCSCADDPVKESSPVPETAVDSGTQAAHADRPNAGDSAHPNQDAGAAPSSSPSRNMVDDAGARPSTQPVSMPMQRPATFDPCASERAALPAAMTSNPKCPNGVFTGDLGLTDQDFGVLQGCVRIDGTLHIYLQARRDLQGLEALRVVEGDLYVQPNCGNGSCRTIPPFDSVRGLDHLRCVGGDLVVGRTNQTKLDTIDGLSELVEVGGSLTFGASKVKVPDQLKALRRVWGDVSFPGALPLPGLESVYGKLTGDRSAAPKLSYIGCHPDFVPCRDGYLGCEYEAKSQVDVDRLGTCEATRQNLWISGLQIREVNALKHLAAVGGNLKIGPDDGASEIESLVGLEALEQTLSLDIRHLPKLISLKPLSALRTLQLGVLSLVDLDALHDLTGLNAVEWQNLFVSDNASLGSLAGLKAQTRVAETTLLNNPQLRDISALKSIEESMRMILDHLQSLPDLSALANLTHAPTVSVKACDALKSLDGLGKLADATMLELADNAGLSTTAGYHGGPTSTLSISNSPQLTRLEGFGPEQGGLTLSRLPALANLHDLSELRRIGTLSIEACAGLTDLTGLESLTDAALIALKDNARLKNLTGLAGPRAIGQVLIDGNPELNSLQGFPSAPSIGLHLAGTSRLQDLTGLEGLGEINYVEITGNAGLTSLRGVSHITAANGTLGIVIEKNPALTSLDGFDALERAGYFGVGDNAVLERLGRFPALRALGTLEIDQNPKLTDLRGMDALVGGDIFMLVISNNAALSDLAGFPALTNVNNVQISGNASLRDMRGWQLQTPTSVYITNNPMLTSVQGLELLRRANDLRFADNPLLTNLDGLSGLRSLGFGLDVQRNASLVSLRGLAGLTMTGSYLTIADNPKLPQCEIERLLVRFPSASAMTAANGPAGTCDAW